MRTVGEHHEPSWSSAIADNRPLRQERRMADTHLQRGTPVPDSPSPPMATMRGRRIACSPHSGCMDGRNRHIDTNASWAAIGVNTTGRSPAGPAEDMNVSSDVSGVPGTSEASIEGLSLSQANRLAMLQDVLNAVSPEARRAARLLVHWAMGASDSARHYGQRARFWRRATWMLGGTAALLATLAGTGALAFGEFPAWTKYCVALASLGSAVLGSVATVLRPSHRYERHTTRAQLLRQFSRDVWSYVVLTLPGADVTSLGCKLSRYSAQLAEIEGGPSDVQDTLIVSPRH
jgi:hypothetical protein